MYKMTMSFDDKIYNYLSDLSKLFNCSISDILEIIILNFYINALSNVGNIDEVL